MSTGRPLRVLRLIARMNVGGPAWQATALTERLDPDQFETRLVTGEVDVGETDYLDLRAPELPVLRLPTLGRSIRPGGDVRALIDVIQEIRRFRPHIVHTHTAKAGVIGRIAARIARSPLTVHTFHGHLLHGYFGSVGTTAVRVVERELARRTTRLVAVGEQVRKDLLEAGIGLPEKFSVIAPGVELPPVPSRDRARTILGLPRESVVVMLVARMTPIKRPDRFVGIARRLAGAYPQAVFAVAGDGELASDVRRMSADLGERFRMLGWRSDLENVYGAADVIVLTSDNEGMPVSLIEASLAGVPCVTPDVGSAREVVDDGTTGFVTSTDEESLVRAIKILLDDPLLRRQFSKAAQNRARSLFGVNRLVRDTEELYFRLAAELVGGRNSVD